MRLSLSILAIALGMTVAKRHHHRPPTMAPTASPTAFPTVAPTAANTSTAPTAPNTTAAPTVAPNSTTVAPTPYHNSTNHTTPSPTTTPNVTNAPTPNVTSAPTSTPNATTPAPSKAPVTPAPSPAPVTPKPVTPPYTSSPTAQPDGNDDATTHWTFWQIVGKTIAWCIIATLSVLAFGAFMSHRRRIFYFLRGVWYALQRLECTQWIRSKLRLPHARHRGGRGGADMGLNTIIFDNEMTEGLLMSEE